MSRPRVNSAIAKTTVPVFFLKAGRVLSAFNLGCEDKTGWTSEAVVGAVCELTSDAEPGTPQALANSLCPPPEVWSGTTREVPAYLACRDGRPQAARIRFVPLPEADGEVRYVMGIVGPFDAAEKRETGPATTLHAELAALRMEQRRRFGFSTFLGASPSIVRVLEQLRMAIAVATPVHFVGNPGTGKEHAARILHTESLEQPGRSSEGRAFVPFRCAEAPRWELKQSMKRLFAPAEEEAAVAAALRPRTVYFADVDRLARDLQQLIVDAFSADPRPSWRLVTSSDRSLEEAVADEDLLEELYYLTTPFVIELPCLRDRREDIVFLAQSFLERGNPWEQLDGFSQPVLDAFGEYNWPGNLDELAAVVAESREACLAGESSSLITPDHLPFRFRTGATAQRIAPAIEPPPMTPLEDLLEQAEREHIREALSRTEGNLSAAAELLGVNRPKLYRRIESLGLNPKTGESA